MSVDKKRHGSLTGLPALSGVFLLLLLIIFLLQYLSGAYRSEFGGYPDEPAHYVTSLMVRDFLIHGHWNEPMKYAAEYYDHYPKVAFGHWPPLLYTLQGIWMVLFSESRASVLIQLAFTSALAAFFLFLTTARYFGKAAGILSAAALISLPVVQTYFDEEMAESLLLVTTFLASVFLIRYFESKRWQDSFLFAIFCSLAVLTKGNGWALAMVPPIAIILTREWTILKRPSFWIAVPVVALLCLPWQVLTLDMAQRGWTGGSKPSVGYTLQALGQFAVITKDMVGWAVIALAAVGIWNSVISPFWSKTVQPLFAVMFGMVVSMWLFHSLVPAGVEERKMINALPALIFFAIAGGQFLARLISQKLSGGRWPLLWCYAGVAAAGVILFLSQTFAIPQEEHFGFTELSSYIESRPELNNSVILVSSDRDGEGLLVSELAMQDKRPSHRILRATKLLSSSDWTGQVSEELCKTSADVTRVLSQQRVVAIVMDTYPRRSHYLHNDLLLQAIHNAPADWRLKSTFADGKIQLYELVKAS